MRHSVCGIVVVLLLAFVGFATKARSDSSVKTWETGAQYLWHEGRQFAPFREQIEIPSDAMGWRPITFPGQPAERTPQRNRLWLRIPFPTALEGQQALFFDAVDEVFDAWVDGLRIYAFGNPEEPDGVKHYIGSKFHLIKLPLHSQDGWIYLRILSAHTNIGPFGAVKIAPPEEIVRGLFVQDIPDIMTIAVLLLLGTVSWLIFAANRSQRIYLNYGAFVGHVAIYLGDRLATPLSIIVLSSEEGRDQRGEIARGYERIEEKAQQIRQELRVLDRFKAFASAASLAIKPGESDPPSPPFLTELKISEKAPTLLSEGGERCLKTPKVVFLSLK